MFIISLLIFSTSLLIETNSLIAFWECASRCNICLKSLLKTLCQLAFNHFLATPSCTHTRKHIHTCIQTHTLSHVHTHTHARRLSAKSELAMKRAVVSCMDLISDAVTSGKEHMNIQCILYSLTFVLPPVLPNHHPRTSYSPSLPLDDPLPLTPSLSFHLHHFSTYLSNVLFLALSFSATIPLT